MKIGQIEKDIPIKNKKHWRTKYPFTDMKVGESVVIKGNEQEIKNCIVASHSYGHRSSKKFLCRKSSDKTSVRIHRTS